MTTERDERLRRLQKAKSAFSDEGPSVDYRDDAGPSVIHFGDPRIEHAEFLELLRQTFAAIKSEALDEQKSQAVLQEISENFIADGVQVGHYLEAQEQLEEAEIWWEQSLDLESALQHALDYWHTHDPACLDESLLEIEEVLRDREPLYDLLPLQESPSPDKASDY